MGLITPLKLSIDEDNVEIATMLLSNGADVDAKDNSMARHRLFIADIFNYYNIIPVLLEYGANILNSQDYEGDTALMKAIYRKYETIVKLLLENGVKRADVNLADNSNVTPLMIASQQGNINLVKLLLKYGANKNALYSGRKAIDFVNSFFHPDIVKLLK